MQEKVLVVFITCATNTQGAQTIKLCLKWCAFKGLNRNRSRVKYLVTVTVEFKKTGLVTDNNLRLNSEIDFEFLIALLRRLNS